MSKTDSGTLYLVATPIGNLEDITLRALRTLRQAAVIAAEDTRVTRRLLNHFHISKPLVSYYEQNKYQREGELLDILRSGRDIALVSDAGTPAISDPGAALAAACIREGLPVVCLPGASALLTLLPASGLELSSFCFQGFLPREKAERRQALNAMRQDQRTLVFYEAPHRLRPVLADLVETFGGERTAAIGRELTKLHEEILRGPLADLQRHFIEVEPRGEFVLAIAGAPPLPPPQAAPEQLIYELDALLAQGLRRKEAARQVAERWQLPVKEVYDLGLKDE